MKLFLDTNVLLQCEIDHFSSTPFVVSSETLRELESIKVNRNKTSDVRYAARHAIHWLAENHDKYEVESRIEVPAQCQALGDTPDVRICSSAYYYNIDEPILFMTRDLSCRNMAEKIFDLQVEWVMDDSDEEEYTGFTEITMSEEEMAYFYEHQNENIYSLLDNQYLIMRDEAGEVVDTYRWDGEGYDPLFKKTIKSAYFEKLKPKDIYQSLVVDSIMKNTITAISAPPGAGKSLLSLMCAMHLIENGKYDHLVILYNPTKTVGAFDMGFYGGNAIEKGLQQFLGQMLSTKFGDLFGVELLIQQGKLKIVSLADCRGMEIRDNEILYMTECQNTTVDLMKIALSRVSSGAKIIIEGDYKTQVDSHIFEGNNNGLRRVIHGLKGCREFGYVELQNVWRSKIAELCEKL